MNTPDTEFDSDKEVVGSDCLCVLGSKKHNPECEYATPDTEWRTHAQRADYFEPDTLVMTLDNIDLLLTSRDTYWKERVGDVKFDIEALRGSPRDTDIEYARAITDVHKILDTLLDNLK